MRSIRRALLIAAAITAMSASFASPASSQSLEVTTEPGNHCFRFGFAPDGPGYELELGLEEPRATAALNDLPIHTSRR